MNDASHRRGRGLLGPTGSDERRVKGGALTRMPSEATGRGTARVMLQGDGIWGVAALKSPATEMFLARDVVLSTFSRDAHVLRY